jgi:gliding motility-associated-like protein
VVLLGRYAVICFILLLIKLTSQTTFAEGTKQLIPVTGERGMILIDKYRSDFGFFDGNPDYRLNIYVADTSERIRFGFGPVDIGTLKKKSNDMLVRVKDPVGSVRFGPVSIPESGQPGYISSYDDAVTGPFAGGYPYIELTPTVPGDYFFEFYYPPEYAEANQHAIEYFDITVVNKSGKAMDGRLWSKAWQLWCLVPESPPSDHRFYGNMIILSDDSIVTQVNSNGMIGGTFSFAANSTGCTNTGNIILDRQSTWGINTYPKYKIFLDDPDSLIYPTSKVTSEVLLPITISTDCQTGSADIGIKVVKDGSVEVLIEVNPSPGQDPQDLKLEAKVKANPGGNNYNIIHWNGRDGLGQPVPAGTTVFVTITYLAGLTHFPLYDIEYNDNGFIVSQVRPKGEQIRIFWDDSQINGSVDTVNGCITGSGCHTWDYTTGNENTINSWWYVKRDQVPPVSFTMKRLPANPGIITGPPVICGLTGTYIYSIHSIFGAERYVWSYSGNGVTLVANDSIVNLIIFPNATSGILSVKGNNLICGDGLSSTLPISIDSVPTVRLKFIPKVCQSGAEIQLLGGSPMGGDYFIDGFVQTTLDPGHYSIGLHTMVYTYSITEGCSNSDTSQFAIVFCEDTVVPVSFPNAFTPGNDGLNDNFRPVTSTATIFTRFQLEVYDRCGQQVCSTIDLVIGWDGRSVGKICPAGVYVWKADFEVQEQKGVRRTMKGTVLLLR